MELIHNGNFESVYGGLHYWGLHPEDRTLSYTIINEDGAAHTGGKCLEFRGQGGTDCQANNNHGDLEGCFYIEQTFEWPVRATGNLSLWAKVDHEYTINIVVTLEYEGHEEESEYFENIYSTEWMRFTCTTRRSYRLLRIRVATLSPWRIYIDDISLEGDFVDPYRPFRYVIPPSYPSLHYEPRTPPPHSREPAEGRSDMNSDESLTFAFMQLLEGRLAGIENKLSQLLTLMSQDQYRKITHEEGDEAPKGK